MKNKSTTQKVKDYFDYVNSNASTVFVDPIELTKDVQVQDDVLLLPSYFHVTGITLTEPGGEKQWDKTFEESQDVLSMLADEAEKEIEQGLEEEKGWDEL